MSTAFRVGIIGTGQVYRRLYEPALRLTPLLRAAGTADPAGGAEYSSAEQLLAAGKLEAVIVLSPPAFHAEHIALATRRGLRVLVEKPPALSVAEVKAWPNPDLVTPAFSRRYWPAYRQRRGPGRRWVFHLQTNPAAWGAAHAESPERDLLPHAADLACWLSGEGITEVESLTRYRSGASGTFVLDAGGRFQWTVAHGGSYAETLTMDGAAVAPASESLRDRVVGRLARRAPGDVAGVAALLTDWASAAQGRPSSSLPTAADARSCAAALEAVEVVAGGSTP